MNINPFDLLNVLLDDDYFDDVHPSFYERVLLGFTRMPGFWDELDDDTAKEIQTHLHICFPEERI
jgi:hypothetical protein